MKYVPIICNMYKIFAKHLCVILIAGLVFYPLPSLKMRIFTNALDIVVSIQIWLLVTLCSYKNSPDKSAGFAAWIMFSQ